MGCVVRGCGEHTSKKAIMCKKHWSQLPKNLQADIRRGTEKGGHTLRANPSREWLSACSKHVGDVKNLVVRVDDQTKRITRKIQTEPAQVPA